MKYQYVSCQPLKTCDFPHLHRQVGITVSESYFHTGLHNHQVEIDREYPQVNTMSTRGWYPANQWREHAAESTRYIIGRMEEVVTELQEHIKRLQMDLQRLEGGQEVPDTRICLACSNTFDATADWVPALTCPNCDSPNVAPAVKP